MSWSKTMTKTIWKPETAECLCPQMFPDMFSSLATKRAAFQYYLTCPRAQGDLKIKVLTRFPLCSVRHSVGASSEGSLFQFAAWLSVWHIATSLVRNSTDLSPAEPYKAWELFGVSTIIGSNANTLSTLLFLQKDTGADPLAESEAKFLQML